MFGVMNIKGVNLAVTMKSCHYVYLVDCSYSMHSDLPVIREHMKTMMKNIMKADDRLSVVFFSGKGEVGSVFENAQINDGTTSMQESVIDSRLKPIGLTCFKDALQYAIKIAEGDDSSREKSLVMMTDGYDNQSQKADIVSLVDQSANTFTSIAFLEYGWHADRDLLADMARRVGGVHIFSEGHNQYERAIEESFNAAPRVKMVEVPVPNSASDDVIYIDEGTIRIVPVNAGKVKIPETLQTMYYVMRDEKLEKGLSEDHLYVILYYAVKMGDDELAWDAMMSLGDTRLVNMYMNAFTRQEISAVEDAVQDAVLDPSKRFIDGKDLNAVPPKDAVTVVDVLERLSESAAELITDEPYFKYNRTSRATDTEQELPRFVKNPRGVFSLRNLVFNKSRPNVSIQVNVDGSVEVPENEFGLKFVPSKIVRNYTIVKDGIINMEDLPVVVDHGTADWLKENLNTTVISETDADVFMVVHLKSVPVINRANVENVNLGDFKVAVKEQQEAAALLKAAKYSYDKMTGGNRKIDVMKEKYGEEAAEWLSGLGVRDYGFSPKVTTKPPQDAYMAVEVTTKIKGLSSLPSEEAMNKKLKEGKKLNIADKTLQHAIEKVGTDCNKMDVEVYQGRLRDANTRLAKMAYSMVLGRKWFDGEDDPLTTDIEIFGEPTTMTVSKDRKEIKI